MMDVSLLPFPDDAPAAGSCVRIERPEPGLAVVVLDPPHRSLAVLDAPLLRDLDLAVDELEGDASLQGVVFTGRAPDQFAAGADVKAIAQLSEPSQVEALVRAVHGLFHRIESLRPFTVAAVGGPVPGGAFELSLCCDRIVATDDPKTRIGLPETQLGIVPGWGGCHRLPRRIGVPAALAAILTGKLHTPKQASRLGLVDRLTKPEYLLRVAADVALKRVRIARARRGTAGAMLDRLGRGFLAAQARRQVLAKTRGKYPAALAAIDLVTRAPSTPPSRFAEREAKAVADLATGPVCKSLIAIFLGMEEQKKLGRSRDRARPEIARVGVIGAGVMGGGVASLCASRGVASRLSDLSAEALDKAQLAHRADVQKQLKRRRIQPHEAAAAIDRLEVTERLEGFQRCDLVIEAVAERLDIKRAVLGELARQAGDRAILATNTSSLSVDAIAAGVPGPERVCGMHFFNPVAKMPLVEVVRGTKTSDETVTAVAALALRLGKTPIVCRDVAGFLVNRVLGPYLDEAVRLFGEGADVARVDRLMLDFGMPMGPFRLLDEVGFDIARHAAASLCAAYGARMTPSDLLERVSTPERLGRKTGLGFYRHQKGKGEPVVADDLARFRQGSGAHDDVEIVDRLVLAMVNEAVRCLEDDVVASPRELDLATVLGTGFAPFRGGVLRYADARGLREVEARLHALAALPATVERTGGVEKFAPALLLRRLVESGETFHGIRAERAVSSNA